MPMGTHRDFLNGGINVSIFLNFNPRLINNFLLQPEFSYAGFRFITASQNMSSFYALGLNASYNIPIFKFLEVNTTLGGGYYINSVVDTQANSPVDSG